MFNPAKASKKIRDEFIDYISTSFSIADLEYNAEFISRLKEHGIISQGPLIEINDIFKSGHSLEFLCENNILSSLFADLEALKPKDSVHKVKLPLSRSLYLHQEQAIETITSKGRNAVITTGTGSGKTECFLIPVINELLREKEAGSLCPGVRALLIYPMNALANDQMKRLRELLMYYPDITFGVYNGDTKKTEREAYSEYCDLHSGESCEELRTPLKNELISREIMNETPPNILCTNYAMLEHLLLRPENIKLFENSDFRFIVLDEAHIYSGATGMETALLLRRLKARINSKKRPQFILTSATLGKKGESEKAIINFAENLCGEKFTADSIVFGQREQQNFVNNVKDVPINLFCELASSTFENTESIFKEYGMVYNKEEDCAANLYDLCYDCSYYRLLRTMTLMPMDLNSFATLLNVRVDEAISFVHVCSLASKNGKSLIDARYHFFIRALEGVYTPLYGTRRIFLTRKKEIVEGDNTISVFERAVCPNCGDLAIVGKIDSTSKVKKLILTPQYDDNTKFFHVVTTNEKPFEEFDDEEIEPETVIDEFDDSVVLTNKQKSYKEYYLCPICGAISEKNDGRPRCEHAITPLLVSEYENTNGKCPKCQNGTYRRFYIGAESATGVLATSLYEELPSKQIIEYNSDGVKLEFEGGKQFLAFSDSRSEAAFFASYLDKSYKEFLRRRGLVQVINNQKKEIIAEPYSLDELVDELTKLFAKHQSFKNDLTEELSRRELNRTANRHAWIAVLTELVYARRRTSLVSLGKLFFEYAGNSSKIVGTLSKKYNIDSIVCKKLLDYLAMSFAYFGALKINDDILDGDDKKYIFYTDKGKYAVLQKTASTDRNYLSWKARNREGSIDSFYPNGRVRIVARILKSDEKTANAFLDDYFNHWLISSINKHHLERGNGDIYHMPVENYIVRIHGDPQAHWFKCKKCGKISQFNIDGYCVENGCDGELLEIDPTNSFNNNHYLNLYNKQDLTTLLIREHTAQLSREEGLKYQTDFEKNRIHALSCSTTFEMGVDVGELETVFLRNVPPSAANYAQRAGRAGRSKDSSAYSLTYAKLSSHDFHYFNEPQKIIVGQIKPPVFKIDNEKIVLRHIYAVVLSYFFKNHPEFFGKNKTKEFLDNGGYEQLVKLINDNPSELQDLLYHSIPNIDQYAWQDKLIGENGILHNAVADYNKTVAEITAFQNEKAALGEYDKAARAQKSLEKYKAKEMIDFLVRNNILPKYGFPIDTVELDVTTDEQQRQELQLSRDLKMAIAEYAPGEKVIANNKMYTSRYIKKSFFNNKMDYYYSYVCQCPHCQTWNYSYTNPREKNDLMQCVACHKTISAGSWREAIEPRGGFVAEPRIEEVPMTRPDRIYHSQDSYIGDGKQIDEFTYIVNGKHILLKSSENDSIMVTSNTDFYVCKYCGFAYGIHDIIRDENGKKDKIALDAIKKGVPYFTLKKKHKNKFGHLCSNTTFHSEKLNHVYKTDVVVIEFQDSIDDHDSMLSAMYAILSAMSDVLDIDNTDINGCLKAVFNAQKLDISYSIVLYDTVAGGAGHVRRLLDPSVLQNVIYAACIKMQKCSCDTSCYNCLRSYSNQKYHDILDRRKAYEFLHPYLGEVKEEIITSPVGTKRIEFLHDGLDVNTESIEYIFSLLTINEMVKQHLLSEFIKNKVGMPDYNDISFRIEGNVGYADLLWKEKNVMLFTKDNEENYMLAKDSDFKCYLLESIADADILINALL